MQDELDLTDTEQDGFGGFGGRVGDAGLLGEASQRGPALPRMTVGAVGDRPQQRPRCALLGAVLSNMTHRGVVQPVSS
jgi:hypothetical protein